MKQIVSCRLLALAALLLVSPLQAAGHARCGDCHGAGEPSGGNLRQPLSGLCIDCHRARVDAGEHAVDIAVARPPAGLPLSAGRMTCLTCHDPHAQGLGLRMRDPQLCEQCHRR